MRRLFRIVGSSMRHYGGVDRKVRGRRSRGLLEGPEEANQSVAPSSAASPLAVMPQRPSGRPGWAGRLLAFLRALWASLRSPGRGAR